MDILLYNYYLSPKIQDVLTYSASFYYSMLLYLFLMEDDSSLVIGKLELLFFPTSDIYFAI